MEAGKVKVIKKYTYIDMESDLFWLQGNNRDKYPKCRMGFQVKGKQKYGVSQHFIKLRLKSVDSSDIKYGIILLS